MKCLTYSSLCEAKKEFESEMKRLGRLIKKNKKIVIWVSWYKKSSGIATDLTEDTIRNFALKNDLVDVKVCAVSDIWSGLKLVVPINKQDDHHNRIIKSSIQQFVVLCTQEDLSIKDFTYDLPEDRIAKYPLPERDASKLLIYRRWKNH